VANTVWKGQLTFGLVSFPVRLIRAARKERVALKYVREAKSHDEQHFIEDEDAGETDTKRTASFASSSASSEPSPGFAPVRQGYFLEGNTPLSAAHLQRGYEVAPSQFVVVQPEELRSLRKATSSDMQILRSVRMQEIDPVFLETSYYVVPGTGGDHSYGLFYRALTETKFAALAQIVMHGREHVMVIRPGSKGLIAHTMFYTNEVRSAEEYATKTAKVSGKELDLAKRFVEAIAESFKPEEFTDKYREELEALIASKEAAPQSHAPAVVSSSSAKIVDIMDALRKSLESAKANRKPPASTASTERKARKLKA